MNANPKQTLVRSGFRIKTSNGTHRLPRRREAGIVLLVFTAFVVLVAAGLLLGRLTNNAQATQQRSIKTAEALQYVKQALIARAVMDPNRPGSLPCPDQNYDGRLTTADYDGGPGAFPCIPDGPVYTRGWLPWRPTDGDPGELGSLEDLPDIRDGAGERLWYVLSNNFRSVQPLPVPPSTNNMINSDNPSVVVGFPGRLGLDTDGDTIADITDIVAIIIAPGPLTVVSGSVPLRDQNRPGESAAHDASALAIEYLEGENADDDPVFVTNGAAPFNDQLVYITRQELMREVEKRVLGEAAAALGRARVPPLVPPLPNAGGVYPWLVPFVDPITSDFRSVSGTREGHLGFIFDTIPPRVDAASLSLEWATGAGSYAQGPAGDPNAPIPDQAKLQSDGPHLDIPSTCTWVGILTAQCTLPSDPDDFIVWKTDDRHRRFTITPVALNLTVPQSEMTVVAPTATVGRTRTLIYDGGLPNTVTIQAEDQCHQVTGVDALCTVVTGWSTPGILTINAGSNITITVGGVPFYDILAADELPAWFMNNQWHHYVYARISPDHVGGGGVDCSANGNCLTLDVAGGPDVNADNIQAMVVSAGPILGAQDRVGTGTDCLPAPPDLCDYFEDENTDDPNDLKAERNRIFNNSAINDQVRIIALDP